MRRSRLKYKWICPICDKTGWKWLSRYRAGKCGRAHLKNVHKIFDKDTEFLIKRVDVNE